MTSPYPDALVPNSCCIDTKNSSFCGIEFNTPDNIYQTGCAFTLKVKYASLNQVSKVYFRLISNSMSMFLRLSWQLFVFSSSLLSYSQVVLFTTKKTNPKKNRVLSKMNKFPNPTRPYKRLLLIQICKFSLVISLSESPKSEPCMSICNVKLQSCRNIFDYYSEGATFIIAKPYRR